MQSSGLSDGLGATSRRDRPGDGGCRTIDALLSPSCTSLEMFQTAILPLASPTTTRCSWSATLKKTTLAPNEDSATVCIDRNGCSIRGDSFRFDEEQSLRASASGCAMNPRGGTRNSQHFSHSPRRRSQLSRLTFICCGKEYSMNVGDADQIDRAFVVLNREGVRDADAACSLTQLAEKEKLRGGTGRVRQNTTAGMLTRTLAHISLQLVCFQHGVSHAGNA